MIDPEKQELENKILGMKKGELLDFYERLLVEGHHTIAMNDHKDCPVNNRIQSEMAIAKAYVLKRLS